MNSRPEFMSLLLSLKLKNVLKNLVDQINYCLVSRDEHITEFFFFIKIYLQYAFKIFVPLNQIKFNFLNKYI